MSRDARRYLSRREGSSRTRTICTIAAVLLSTAAAQTFEVASVKPTRSNDPPYSNFPLGPGDVYVPNGGLFSAKNLPLVTYVFFAYKIMGNQGQFLLPQLPDWTKTERFDIQARAEGNPRKDDMRLLMRALLADRFKLAMRNETREVPVLAFVLAKPGKTGPNLQPHLDTAPCPTNAPTQSQQATSQTPGPSQTVAGGFPALCNGIFGMPPKTPGHQRLCGRNLTLKFIADSLSAGADLGRPMIDKTGLTGTFDFTLEFAIDNGLSAVPGANPPPDGSGPTLQEALQEQLGIKLQSDKASMSVYVLDHVEHPSEN
jgi:uncharacterized protein (TIGR03435 family)